MERPDDLKPGEWLSLFDGRSLRGWKALSMAGRKPGDVRVSKGAIVTGARGHWTGVAWTQSFPKDDYELTFEAMRLGEPGGFCQLAFPVGESHCRLNVGDWGGSTVAVDLIDGVPGPRNPTARTMSFETKRWYKVRLRVAEGKIQAWIDDRQMVDFATAGHHFALPPGSEGFAPFGLASKDTAAAFRNIAVRRLKSH